MEQVSDYLSLNPDAFTRFHICKEILAQSFGQKAVKLLDVGGGSQYFRVALEQAKLSYQLTVIDILPPPQEVNGYAYVQGDATKMDFADESFDAVVSMDVLEHVSDAQKATFLQECYRVAKDLVVIAAPFDSPAVTEAETMANDFFRSFHGRDHPWLIEHFEQNKPKVALIEREIARFGCPYLHFESNHLPAWLKMILINFMPHFLIDPTKVRGLNQLYNNHLLALRDFDSPGYRQFYILYKKPTLAKTFEQYFKPRSAAHYQLTLESKTTELFVTPLQEAEKLLTASAHLLEKNLALTHEIEQRRTTTASLTALLEEINASKSYQVLRWPGALRSALKGKR